MTLTAKFEGTSPFNNSTKIFRIIPLNETIYVEWFKKGIAKIEIPVNVAIKTITGILPELLKEECNFEEVLLKAYNSKSKERLLAFYISYNGGEALIQKEGAGIKRVKKQRKKINNEEIVEDVLRITTTERMLFKNSEAHKLWDNYKKEMSTKAYGVKVYEFAERFAKYMQHVKRRDGQEIKDIAGITSCQVDLDGINTSMYFLAIEMLGKCWVHGEELLLWHKRRCEERGLQIANSNLLTNAS